MNEAFVSELIWKHLEVTTLLKQGGPDLNPEQDDGWMMGSSAITTQRLMVKFKHTFTGLTSFWDSSLPEAKQFSL